MLRIDRLWRRERVALLIADDVDLVLPWLNLRALDILNCSRELLLVLERTMPERLNARIVDTLDDATALSLATGDMFVTRSPAASPPSAHA